MKKIINIWILLFLIGCSEKRDFPIVIQLDELKFTNLSFTDNQRIDSENNQIYCPTLLFAWNHLKEETNSVLDKAH